MTKGFEHVGISVANLQRSTEFYRDLLGMELIVDGAAFEGTRYETILALTGVRGRVSLLRKGNMQLELFEFDCPKPRSGDPDRPVCDHGITHFCIGVEDIEREYRRLKTTGVRFHCPPLDFEGGKATYGRDPDGNVFELVEMT